MSLFGPAAATTPVAYIAATTVSLACVALSPWVLKKLNPLKKILPQSQMIYYSIATSGIIFYTSSYAQVLSLAVVTIPISSYIYLVYVPSWAKERAAAVSQKDFYKAQDSRDEFEKREKDYAKARDKLVTLVMNPNKINCDSIMESLSEIRGSIFFDDSYRTEYDILWTASLAGKVDVNQKELIEHCNGLGIDSKGKLPDVDNTTGTFHISKLLTRLCAKMRN